MHSGPSFEQYIRLHDFLRPLPTGNILWVYEFDYKTHIDFNGSRVKPMQNIYYPIVRTVKHLALKWH